jgi:hypothetical protein
MPRTTPLLKFVFDYKRFHCRIPIVPVRFVRFDKVSTQIINAVLDSGADAITIPKELAQWLQLKLEPVKTSAMTAAGTTNALVGKAPEFILGQGGREVKYEDVEIYTMEHCPYTLIGIAPVFEDYDVTILASQRRFKLEPRKKATEDDLPLSVLYENVVRYQKIEQEMKAGKKVKKFNQKDAVKHLKSL